jgi:hypothetical protein
MQSTLSATNWKLPIQDIIKTHTVDGNVEFVIEDYRLYHHKGMSASTQANSLLETNPCGAL